MEGSYFKLAEFMGKVPEARLFSSFPLIRFYDLLTLQAELADRIQQWYDAIDADSGDPERRQWNADIQKLREYKGLDGKPAHQWLLWQEVRHLNRAYSDALLREYHISRLPSANKSDHTALSRWLSHERGANCFLEGFDRNIYTKIDDLVSLSDLGQNSDLLSQFVRDKVVWWFHDWFDRKRKSPELALHYPPFAKNPVMTPVVSYKDSSITIVVDAISTVLSSLIPILSILALSSVRATNARLGVTFACAFVFSVSTVLVGRAKKAECFAATAAFVAVAVVFIGNAENTTCKSTST